MESLFYLLFGYFVKKTENNETSIYLNDTITESNFNDDSIYVHIIGEVNNPGIKKVPIGTRLYELIELSSGETENADLSRLNLSSVLKDEQKVIVPAIVVIDNQINQTNKDATKSTVINYGQVSTTNLVNLNYATKEQLKTLSGIGDSTAQKIIDYRTENGLFNSIEEIKNISGIGESKFNKIKDDITI